MASDFGKLLESLAHKHFKSMRGLARHIAPDSEDTNASFWSRIVRDVHPPPAEMWDKWADAFGLKGAARQHFMDLAAIAHIPPPARHRFLQLVKIADRVEARLKILEARKKRIKEPANDL